ncbi:MULTISPECIES: hypothetical protein [Crocosphaera]|uniref:Uncharacterized protein n=5 Tax=Crocosphaera watsonii TaxID=263511 RepID=T2J4I8_CROWT|nr:MULTISPECIES: hypothetical protein [Crocosphaera]MCH2247311.1 hypothetical protein [Crocosphaera sp.]NQZ60572.1 hypothetical protein [Crocosphaera sp.]CCQ60145.1 hypothetical protein CWATWH0401_406 [Crocosphaera watsonii WH 0401]
MGNKTTMEFVAGKNSTALIRKVAKDLDITEEEVVQKGITFMKLYAGLQKSKRGRILLEADGETQEIIV